MAFRRGDPTRGTGRRRCCRSHAAASCRSRPEGDGARLTTRVRGRRHATPLLILIIAIGVTDVLFAVDSIPAIFGLTSDPFLVFAANLFALARPAAPLLPRPRPARPADLPVRGPGGHPRFIGLKLISQALRGYGIDHVGPVPVPEVSAGRVAGGHRRGAADHHREQPGRQPAPERVDGSDERASRGTTAARRRAPGAGRQGSHGTTSDAGQGRTRQTGPQLPGRRSLPGRRVCQAAQGRPPVACRHRPRSMRARLGGVIRRPQERRGHAAGRPRDRLSPSRRWPAW